MAGFDPNGQKRMLQEGILPLIEICEGLNQEIEPNNRFLKILLDEKLTHKLNLQRVNGEIAQQARKYSRHRKTVGYKVIQRARLKHQQVGADANALLQTAQAELEQKRLQKMPNVPGASPCPFPLNEAVPLAPAKKVTDVPTYDILFTATVSVPDDFSETCLLCREPFTMFSNRRSHCRACGELVCKKCSKQKQTLYERSSYKEQKSQRVCDLCHDYEGKNRPDRPNPTPINLAEYREERLGQIHGAKLTVYQTRLLQTRLKSLMKQPHRFNAINKEIAEALK